MSRGFRSRARNHLQATRLLEFRGEVMLSAQGAATCSSSSTAKAASRLGSARRTRTWSAGAPSQRDDDPPGSENSCSVTYALNAEASSESQLEFDTVDVNRVLAAMDEARQPGESRDPRCLPGQPLCAELPLRRLARAGADGGGQGHLHRLRDGSRFGGLGGGLATTISTPSTSLQNLRSKRTGRTTVARVERAVMRTEPGTPQA